MQVLTDSNLSILGDMVKSLSKRAIKQQSSVEQLTQELTQCKGESLHHSIFSCFPWDSPRCCCADQCQASWQLITEVGGQVTTLQTEVQAIPVKGKKGKRK